MNIYFINQIVNNFLNKTRNYGSKPNKIDYIYTINNNNNNKNKK